MVWISCSDRLPDSDQTVLICSASWENPVWMGYHDGNEWRCIDAFPCAPTHWAELPEPAEAC